LRLYGNGSKNVGGELFSNEVTVANEHNPKSSAWITSAAGSGSDHTVSMRDTQTEHRSTDAAGSHGPPCPVCERPLHIGLLSVRGPLVTEYRCEIDGLMSYGMPFSG